MDRFEISTLRYYYGSLLTDRQNDMLVMHYDEDLSYGEIAEICGISRQAVLDGINKGEKHLAFYEEKLHLVEKDRQIHELLNGIHSSDSDVVSAVDAIKRVLEE